MVPNRSSEPLQIPGCFWCQYLCPRATFRRLNPFCSPGLETSVKIGRQTDLLAMIIQYALTMFLDALEICELESRALCFFEIVPCEIECFEGVAFVTACRIEFARGAHTRARLLTS
jgi:hypothetical protein